MPARLRKPSAASGSFEILAVKAFISLCKNSPETAERTTTLSPFRFGTGVLLICREGVVIVSSAGFAEV